MALVPVAGRLEPYDGAGGRVVDEILDEVCFSKLASAL